MVHCPPEIQTIDTLYLSHEGELWGVFCEYKLWLMSYECWDIFILYEAITGNNTDLPSMRLSSIYLRSIKLEIELSGAYMH